MLRPQCEGLGRFRASPSSESVHVAPAPPLPGPSVVSAGQGVGRGGGLGRGQGPGAQKTLATRVTEGRRRAREGPEKGWLWRGRGGKGTL